MNKLLANYEESAQSTSSAVTLSRELHVLIVEDSPADAEICLAELNRAGIPARGDVVFAAAPFRESLRTRSYDLVLADYSLPGWSGLEALEEFQRENQDLPFILITGSLGEENAVECIKRGATDYVLKDRIARLPFAVRRALLDKELRDERTRAADALRESERMLWTLMSNLPGMAYRCLLDEQSTLEFVSEGSLELTGHPTSHLIKQSGGGLDKLIYPEDRLLIHTEILDSIKNNRPYSLLYRIYTASGELKWIWDQGRAVVEPGIRPSAREGFLSDISARKRAEEDRVRLLHDLRKRVKEQSTLNRIALLLQHTTRPIDETLKEIVAAIPSGWQFPNIAGACITLPQSSWHTQNFTSTPWFQRTDFPTPEGTGSIEVVYLEERPQAVDGPFLAEERTLLCSIALALAAFLEHRNIVARLSESESKYRSLFESAQDGICLLKGERVIDANSCYLQMFACTREELTGRAPWEFSPLLQPDGTPSRDRAEALLLEALEGRLRSFEWRHRRLDGTEFDVEVSLSCVEVGKQPLFQAILRDITARKRAADALARSEATYRSLMQGAVLGIFRGTTTARFLQVNPALVEMLGYESEQELVTNFSVTDVYARPADAAQLFLHLRLHHRVDGFETDWKRKDGSILHVRITGRALLNPAGQIDAVELMAEDVTARRALEKQLFLAQKFEAIGQLAGGIAHDFNNVLGAVLGWAELGQLEAPESSTLHNYFHKIAGQASHAATLTKQLLAFSRRQILDSRNLNLNQMITDSLTMLRRVLSEEIEIRTILAPDLSVIRADPSHIEQVLMNLCVNARDAMPQGGHLLIETRSAAFDEEYCRLQAFARPGKYVQLAVTDVGTGMSPAVLERIFEPFFTTKDVGKGTGLGLATVYGIVKQHGGFIHVYSELGAGSTFRAYFPVAAGAADVIEPPRSVPVRGGSETILLAEDHEGLREMANKSLTALGYTVLLAADGEEAVRIFTEQQHRITLVILDIVLPKLRGPDVFDCISKIKPGIPVLFCTGYSEEASFVSSKINKGTPLLSKPYAPQKLAQKVRELLDKSLLLPGDVSR